MTYVYSLPTGNYFYHWQQSSDTYKDTFSYKESQAICDYYEGLAEDMGEPILFDPIAWLCDISKVGDLEQLEGEYGLDSIDDLRDRTTLITEEFPILFINF